MVLSNTKARILDTASELFYNKGYNLVGINEIIEKSGIAKATLYSHFKTKEELLLSYLDKMNKDLLISLTEFVDARKNGNDKLISVLEFLYPFFKQKNFNGCWCIRTLAEVPRENKMVRKKIKQHKTDLINFISQLVKENKPKLNSRQQKILARQIYLLYEGAISESHLLMESWPLDASVELLKLKLNARR